MNQVIIALEGQRVPLLIETGSLGLALKQMADTSENAAKAQEAAREAEAARDDTINGLTAKANKNGDNITAPVSFKENLGLSPTTLSIPSKSWGGAPPDVIRTDGNAVTGDGGGAEYVRVASVPAHSLYKNDADGNVFAITRRTIRLSQAGTNNNDLASQSDAINRAFAYAAELGDACIEIDDQREYLLDARVGAFTNYNGTIRLENKAGGVLKAANTLSTEMVRIGRSGATAASARFIAHDLYLDNSLGIYIEGAASCSGFSAQSLEYFELNGFKCSGGFDAAASPSGFGGDSGISCVGTRVGIINDADISGQPDNAIYPNFDNSGNIGGYLEVNRGRFYRNKFVASAKRNLEYFIMRGSTCFDNEGGISVQRVSGQGPGGMDLAGARYMLIDGVLIDRTRTNVFVFRDVTKGGVQNCIVRDVGRRYDGTSPAGANGRVFYALGASGLLFQNNVIEMARWEPGDEIAHSFSNSTLNGAPHTGGNHTIAGNTYRNWSRYSSGGSDGLPSVHQGEVFDGLGVASRFSALNAKSRVDYRNMGETVSRSHLGGVEYVAPQSASVTTTESSAVLDTDSGKTFNNSGATSPVAFTLPSAGTSRGLEFTFVVMSANNVRINAVGNDSIRTDSGSSTVAGYAESASPYGSITLKNIDSNNWVATAQRGTWAVG